MCFIDLWSFVIVSVRMFCRQCCRNTIGTGDWQYAQEQFATLKWFIWGSGLGVGLFGLEAGCSPKWKFSGVSGCCSWTRVMQWTGSAALEIFLPTMKKRAWEKSSIFWLACVSPLQNWPFPTWSGCECGIVGFRNLHKWSDKVLRIWSWNGMGGGSFRSYSNSW